MDFWRSCYGTREVDENCSALLISLNWLWVYISASARNSDHPSAYQLVLTADRDVQACPYFSYRELNVGL